MSYEQTKVSEFFSKRKNCDGFQPSKLRKVTASQPVGDDSDSKILSPPIGARTRSKKFLDTPAACQINTKRRASKTTRSRKTANKLFVTRANQPTLQDTLERLRGKVEREAGADSKRVELVPTAACDNHNTSPQGSPTKRTVTRSSDSELNRKRSRAKDSIRKDLFQHGNKPGFVFDENVKLDEKPTVSPRRLIADSTAVFRFLGKEKDTTKETRMKQLLKDFSAVSSRACRSDTPVSERQCLKKEDDPVPVVKASTDGAEQQLPKIEGKVTQSVKDTEACKSQSTKCANIDNIKEKLSQLQECNPRTDPCKPSSSASGDNLSTALQKRETNNTETLPLAELKTKTSAAMKDPALLKARLSKCTNLSELKQKLKQLQPATPKKKIKEKLQIQSPVKPSLTEAAKEAAAKTSSCTAEKKPAYQRFASMQDSIPPGLVLPKSYKLLFDMFIAMDTIVSILHKRPEVCTFSKLKTAVQQMTRRNFELKHLAQVKTVYPTAFDLRQEKNVPVYGKKKSNGYELTVEVNLVNDPLSNQSDATALTKDGRPDFTTARIIERKTTFHRKLIDILLKHHRHFLSKLDPPLSIPDHKVTKWHPKFNLEDIPEIDPAELPKAQNVHVITTAKEALEHAKEKFSGNSRVIHALEKVAAKNELNDGRNKEKDNVSSPKPKTNTPQKSTDNQSLKGVSQSFLEKIRAKEARKQQEEMLRSPADEMKKERMGRLPELVRIIRTAFVTNKKQALPKADVIEVITESYKACMGQAEAELHVNLLTELVPDWISVLRLKCGEFVTIDRNKDINTITKTLNRCCKEI